MKNMKENRNSFTYAFKQQLLPAWKPVATLHSTIITFIVLGSVFLGLGTLLTVLSENVQEYKVRYDEICSVGSIMDPDCDVTIEVKEKMKAPVFIYYELHNFYQNHRTYLKSRDNDQLSGKVKSVSQLGDCDPVKQNKDIAINLKSYTGVALDPEAPANPCGLVAKSYFNDVFKVYPPNSATAIDINSTGIAWESDLGNKFKKAPNSENIQWIDVTNEHFVVWMRTAATKDFKKLWGRIEKSLEAGEYKVSIQNNYDVDDFNGEKYVVLSTANVFGGKNDFLSVAYLILGFISYIFALIFFVKGKVSKQRHLPKFE